MNPWKHASQTAEKTPESRNRYIDFLRASSILFVVFGHWLMSTAVFNSTDHSVTPVSTLVEVPWTKWLTWLFQVMPIFFIVGGYANALSLESAKQKKQRYSEWLAGRLQRLLNPLVFLLITWGVISCILRAIGLPAERVALVSQLALVPTWFLACYALIVMLAPLSYTLWRRTGLYSLALFMVLGITTDLVVFATGNQIIALTNYLWIWLAIHHLGFAWFDRRTAKPRYMLLMSCIACLVLLALVMLGPYSIAMAGAPENELSNSLPPKMTLLALGLMQFGLIISVEKSMQRLLQNKTIWTATVLVSSMIMSIYLWHMTVLLSSIACAYLLGGIGLTLQPGSSVWWLSRIAWLSILGLTLIPIAMSLSPLERISRGKQKLHTWKLISGCLFASAGIAIGSTYGYNGDLSSMLFVGSIGLAIIGAAMCGATPLRRNPTSTRTYSLNHCDAQT